jgi:uncharacterized protein YndB with AHSA1/START domain
MSDLVIERNYAVPANVLFKAITEPASLAAWFGPEGVGVVDHDLSLDRLGPWFAELANAEGQKYKMSGVVTRVDAPVSVAFTWAWHDESDARGHESNVTFDVVDLGDGSSKLTLTHRGLVDQEQRDNHSGGWTSSLTKLPKVMGL